MTQAPTERTRYVIVCDECDGLGHDDDWAWPRTCSACQGTGCVDEDDIHDDGDWQNDCLAMNDDPGM